MDSNLNSYVNIKQHRLYNIAKGILRRCNNKKDKDYKYYGEKGIKCLLGKNTREVINSLLTINGWEEGLTIDRVDNNGDYTLGNLKWSTMKEQNCNRAHSLDFDKLKNVPRTHYNFLRTLRNNTLFEGLSEVDFIKIFVCVDKKYQKLFTYELVCY